MMEESDSHTDSLRAERGKRPDEDEADQSDTPMSLGSMIRGPIGAEGAHGEITTGSEGADADADEAERREG
jgi:hypothetical protein